MLNHRQCFLEFLPSHENQNKDDVLFMISDENEIVFQTVGICKCI